MELTNSQFEQIYNTLYGELDSMALDACPSLGDYHKFIEEVGEDYIPDTALVATRVIRDIIERG